MGRSTVNNEVIVGTLSGEVITVRTIRRLPQEEQQDKTLIDKLNVHHGHQRELQNLKEHYHHKHWSTFALLQGVQPH